MRIAVLGTLSMDLVAEVDRLPRPGETVSSRGLARQPGGKGTLQAIAAARLGAEVTLYGRVGTDSFGDEVLATVSGAGVNTAPVERLPGEPTGTSLILAGPNRQTLAAHAPGANGKIDEGYISRFLPQIQDANAVLLDLGVPIPAVMALLRGLPPARPVVVLNPITAHNLSGLPWERVDFLVGNREEFATRTGWTAGGPEEAARAGQTFLDLGVRNLVITAGPDGAYLVEKAGATRFPAHDVPVVDPTGAGDAFSAALAVKLAAGRGPYEAVGFASAVATLTVTKKGAVSAFPTAAEVQAFLSRQSSLG
ncbi:MAG: ribokinase [Candidatus Bipolaricaulota bacterium]